MVKILPFILFIPFFTALGFPGGEPGTFLSYGATPRSLGLGKTFCGLADDQSAAYFNPAGLSQILSHEVQLSHLPLYGARMEYIGYALPTKFFGSFGLSFINYGTEGLDPRSPENYQGNPTFFYENAYIFSYAYSPIPNLSFGMNLKIIAKALYIYSGAGFGADFGIFYKPLPYLSSGFFLANLLPPKIKMLDFGEEETYPRSFRFGLCWRTYEDRVKVLFDLLSPTKGISWEELDPHFGIEFELIRGLFIQRAGLDKRELAFGLGVGRTQNKFSLFIDYALLLHYQSNFLLLPTHKLGIALKFGGFRVWAEGNLKVFSPQPGVTENLLGINLKYTTKRKVKRWQLLIKNELGEVVRSYSGWEEVPTRLTWDGLDEATRLVADGRYYYEITLVDTHNESFRNYGFLTTVKTTGPAGKIKIKE
jgi:hypothetical protein|uniref:PorV/PorQ family protein n=1 Tax=candidate division WOR-3 bacterium TaxID=2052148 RepID=A0A7C3UR63_UNCW3